MAMAPRLLLSDRSAHKASSNPNVDSSPEPAQPDRSHSVLITPVDKGFRLSTAMWLPHPIDEVFAFFADAGNLDLLTPEWVRFRIATPLPIIMKRGVLIDYRLRLHGMRCRHRAIDGFRGI